MYVFHSSKGRIYRYRAKHHADADTTRFEIAKLLTVAGMRWTNFPEIESKPMKEECMRLLPLGLQDLCRSSLRNHLSASYPAYVKDAIIPETIRSYLLFQD